MSDERGDPTTPQPPNWGNAYPPPPQYPPPYPPPGYGAPYSPYVPLPAHPRATTAMVLGIVGMTGFMCYVTFLVAPAAWIIGAKAVKEIDANPGMYGGRSEANAGKIMGIVGTVLLILALLALTAFVIVSVTIDGFWDDSYDESYFIGGLV